MRIHEIMTRGPILLRPEQTLAEVLQIFMENKIDGAPVVDHNDQLIGLITKSHIYRTAAKSMDDSIRVEELMTRDVFAGHPEDQFEDVVTPMVPRLPVIDDDNKVIGMLTRGDIANAFFNSYQNISSELDTIINSTHNMIISIDKHGKIKVFNRAAERLLEIKAEDVVGKPIREVLPSSRLIEVMQGGQAEPLQRIEINGRNFMSNRSPIIKEGKTIGAVAVLQDISEIEKISKELQIVTELHEQLDAIIESSYDGLYITDGQGITLRLNKAFEMISGIKAHEFMQHDVEDIEAAGVVSQSVTKAVLQQREPATIIQQYKTGRTALATGNPVFDKNGRIFRVVCNVRDITELNMLKHKLEQVQGLSQHYASELRNLRIKYSQSLRMVANSAIMRKMLEMVLRVAQVESTILITGASGTGKELIAEIIHENSPCRKGPYLKINCGAIPENLLESELFGYEGGAFTGARKEGKPGYFELATGGTLFLDEIAELPLGLQVKLLRVLQSKEITRVGGTTPFTVDVRIIAATNRDLLEMVKNRQFRGDLYYRLNVLPVHVPTLRERKDDIPNLVVHFMKMFNQKYQLTKRISPEVVDILMGYDWPGNVRELENLIERLVVITPGDTITWEDLPAHLLPGAAEAINGSTSQVLVSGIIPLRDAVASVEKQILEQAYMKYRTTRQMARELKVDVSTVVRKAAKYGISSPANTKR
ncbi:MAG: sigma 54-interacting transcriptional regulator [Syntrophomonadaceae bacterium]|jgi:PAS domain S-box-containing protein/TyrR family helix-turn-helix protein